MRRLILALLAVAFATGVNAAELGDDGLHKTPWMRDTFKDLNEDLAEANAEGKRLMLMFEQRGCVYCTKMHNEVFPDPDVTAFIEDNYFVVQLNLHGDTQVMDFDGETLSEKTDGPKMGHSVHSDGHVSARRSAARPDGTTGRSCCDALARFQKARRWI